MNEYLAIFFAIAIFFALLFLIYDTYKNTVQE
jgi:hypothetical protein